MRAPSARLLRIPAVLFCGFLLAWAAGARWNSVRAQSNQSQTAPPQTGAEAAAPTQPPQSQQAGAPPAAPAQPNSDAAEMTTQETSVPLRVLVNLVPLRVIVRDSKGNAISNLRKEDFQLFQDGKPQVISNFSVVLPAPAARSGAAAGSAPTAAAQSGEASPPAFLPPSRFVALLFDDAHINMQDAMQSRIAATKYIDASLASTDRAAVYTMSGQFQVDFTEDRAKLHASINSIQPRAVTAVAPVNDDECPPMDLYEADEIANNNDDQAINVATQDALKCSNLQNANPQGGGPTPAQVAAARALAESLARRKVEEGDAETEAVFRRLREIMARMATLPGQRNIVLISPGFIYPNLEVEYSNLIDSAIRQNIFINTLDARGLYVPDLNGDISQATYDPNPSAAGIRTTYRLDGQRQQTQTLRNFADDTGGWAFHDNNDLLQGLREVASAPDAYYFLAYVPANMKFDGHFHSLKVTLLAKNKYTIQARRGYFAPRHGETPEEVARRDVEDAVFSQEERHGVPIGLQTQYYKTDATDAKLAVLAHVDLAHVRFTKADGRNQDDLTVVAAIFDRNGNFVTGTERLVSMKLRDETFQKLSRSGVTVRTSFDLKPGDYVVRLVVRDANAAALSAANGVVEIPY
jgi:VWFA-related protein